MNIVKSNLSFKYLSLQNKPNTIVLHHAEASKCTIEDIHRWHIERGWSGVGYHYFVRKDGTIYTGRPENAIGSHCLKLNTNSLGISAEGAYMTETMPEVQKLAIVELIKDIMTRHKITHIYGHKELMSTSCPGDKYPLNEIKKLALSVNTPPPSTSIAPRTYLQVGDKGEKVAYLQKSLISLGFDLGKAGADGDFGKNTKTAVYLFQKGIGMEADGLGDNETFKAIEDILKLPLCSVKKQGSDYAIKFLQYKFGIHPDGLFTQFLEETIKDFQKKNKLSIDGAVGPKTWAKLLK